MNASARSGSLQQRLSLGKSSVQHSSAKTSVTPQAVSQKVMQQERTAGGLNYGSFGFG